MPGGVLLDLPRFRAVPGSQLAAIRRQVEEEEPTVLAHDGRLAQHGADLGGESHGAVGIPFTIHVEAAEAGDGQRLDQLGRRLVRDPPLPDLIISPAHRPIAPP